MSRWAVLWDVIGDIAKPVGLAVEHAGHVHVFVPPSYGVPSKFSGEYQVLQPDGSVVTYRPGMEGYFDQVLVELSRAFGVGKQEVGPELDQAGLIDLYVHEVAIPQRRAIGHGQYVSAATVAVGSVRHSGQPVYRPRSRGSASTSRRHALTVA
jgi:hypothetical protein